MNPDDSIPNVGVTLDLAIRPYAENQPRYLVANVEPLDGSELARDAAIELQARLEERHFDDCVEGIDPAIDVIHTAVTRGSIVLFKATGTSWRFGFTISGRKDGEP